MDLNKIYEPYVKYATLGSVESLGWSSEDVQQIRFKIISEIGIENSDSVLDVGCGYGDFSYHVGERYLGIDMRDYAVEMAREKYKLRNFKPGSVFDVHGSFDWIVASGIFSFNYDNWEVDTITTIKKMYELANKGVAVNFLSAKDDLDTIGELRHEFPGFVIDKIIMPISNKFTLRHDYGLEDFTVYLYK